MKRRLALAIGIIFIWGIMAPAFADVESIGVRTSPINPKKAFATSESTKHSVAGIFASKKLMKSAYKKGQLIVKVKNKDLINKEMESKYDFKIEKKLMEDMVLVSFDDTKRSLEKRMGDLNRSEAIYFAEPNYIHVNTMQVQEPSPTLHSLAPTLRSIAQVPSLASQWGLVNSNAVEAWSITSGSPDVLVGVIDTGVDYNHQDLQDNIYKNPAEIPGDGLDNDKNGYVDDTNGYDFGESDNDPMDNDDHGTHVAGIIAAEDNNIDVVGVAPKVKILPLKISDVSVDNMTVSAAIEATTYGIKMGVEVFNCSYGSYDPDPAEYAAIQKNPDALFICASGNGDENNVAVNTDLKNHYPSDYELPNIISVGAIDQNNQLASFSNYGKTTVDLAAPGVQIRSTIRNKSYDYMSGTSMATPFVTGTVALMRSINPYISMSEVKKLVLTSVAPVASMSEKLVTGGKLDVNEAVREAQANIEPITGIELSKSTLGIYTNTSAKLDAVLLPMKVHSRLVKWASSNTALATVDEKGNVKALSSGKVVISATDSSSGFSASCQVTVTNFKPPVIRPGSKIIMTFKTSKFIDGNARLWMIRPDGTEDSFAMKADFINQTYTVSITADKDGNVLDNEFDPFKYYGTWEPELIEVTDSSDQTTTFYNEKYFDSENERSFAKSYETYKFIASDNIHPAVDTSVARRGTSVDKTLTSSIVPTETEISAKEVYQGNEVNLRIFAKARAGLYTAYITFVKPDGTTFEENMGADSRDSFFYCNMKVSKVIGSGGGVIDGVNDEGLWRVKSVRLLDSTYNELVIEDNRFTIDPGALDLSNLDFTVFNQQVLAGSIAFQRKTLTLGVGKIVKPFVTFNPENTSDKRLVYSTSNAKIATVNSHGVITTKKAGIVTIKAKMVDGSAMTSIIKITVK